MLQVTENEIKNRLAMDNSWWGTERFQGRFPTPRAYLDGFHALVTDKRFHRAVVLMGPRRVGKTVMIHHLVERLIAKDGVPPRNILYVSLDTPLYSSLAPEKILQLFFELKGHDEKSELFVIYDEIQYQKDWERHLKSMVDAYRNIRFVASGSAAATLRMKSRESGAGRFTDFMLPPLAFCEYLDMLAGGNSFSGGQEYFDGHIAPDIRALNRHFVNYLNRGGFPEMVKAEMSSDEFKAYVGRDIVDKVLLRDIPSLYGISDIQSLNRLFSTLAFNTAQEISISKLSQTSGIAENTIRRHLDYLEAAYLIARVNRIDETARHFKRRTTFKVYLTNPSIYAALFGEVTADNEPLMGRLVETGFLAQLLHLDTYDGIHYARWHKGEIDFVFIDSQSQKPIAATEIKWSDRVIDTPSELVPIQDFCRRTGLLEVNITTRQKFALSTFGKIKVDFVPTSLVYLAAGKAAVSTRIKALEDAIKSPTGNFLNLGNRM